MLRNSRHCSRYSFTNLSIETLINSLYKKVPMETYNLELEKAVKAIKDKKAKLVCLQLPDGLKPRAQEIEEQITSETGARVVIWLGSNFGACDIPVGLN